MVDVTKKATIVTKPVTKKASKTKTGKKLVLTKKEKGTKKEPAKCDFNFWELSNSIETVSYKITSVKDVIEMVATNISSDPESGAAWAAVEMLGTYIQTLENLAGEAMEGHRQYGGKSARDVLFAAWDAEWT